MVYPGHTASGCDSSSRILAPYSPTPLAVMCHMSPLQVPFPLGTGGTDTPRKSFTPTTLTRETAGSRWHLRRIRGTQPEAQAAQGERLRRGDCQTKRTVRAFRQSQRADPADPAQVEWRPQKATRARGVPLRVRLQPGLYPRGLCREHCWTAAAVQVRQGPGSGSGAGGLAGLGTWDCDSGSHWLRAWSREAAQVWPRTRPGCFAGRMGTFTGCWQDSGLGSRKPLGQKAG